MERDTTAADGVTRRGMMLVLAVGVLAYLGWRLATVVGDPSVAAIALWIVEVVAWIGLAAFLTRVGHPYRPARVGPVGPLPTITVVAILTSGRPASALERTLASLDTGTGAPAVLVVDDTVRPDVSKVAAHAGATVLAASDASTTAAVLALAPVVPDDAAVVLVEAGSLLAAGAPDALVAPMADATVGAVQGALDWADPATITVHGPSRDGLRVIIGREAPAAGVAGVAPILSDGVALRARALGAINPHTKDLTVAFAAAGWLVRFADTPVVYRPRPASASQWRAIRSTQISSACRSARAATRARGLTLSTRTRIVAGAGDVASAYARIGLVALVVTALVSGSVPVPGPLGATFVAAATLWIFATAAVHTRMTPVLRVGDRLRLGWHRLDADLLAPFTRPPRASDHGGRIRALASFPVSVVALVAVDAAAFVRGLALLRPSIVPAIPTTLERATIGVVTIGVLVLLFDSLRIFVARPDGRVDLRVPARVAAILGTQPAELRDLSPTGAGLICTDDIPPGTAVQLRFTLSADEELAIDGRVARAEHIETASGSSYHHLGVQFAGMSPETHRALVRYVATTAPSAAAAAAADALPRASSVPLPRPVLQFASVMALIVASISLVAAPAGAAPSTQTPTTRFAGTISGPSGPLAGACVSAVDANWQFSTVVTDRSGTYTLEVPAGPYRIQVRDCNPTSGATPSVTPSPAQAGVPGSVSAPTERLAGGWWSSRGLQTQSGAETVTGADGATTRSIDVTLPVGGWFTGAVQDPAANPVDGICITPVTSADEWDGGTTTPSNGGRAGQFETQVLIPGQYRLAVNDCGSRSGLFARGWIGRDGTTVSAFERDALTFDVGRSGIDVGTVTLQYGTRIAGTVTDETGAPASGICVGVVGDDWQWVGGGNTGRDGAYTTDALPEGDWALSFNDCNATPTLVGTFWDGSPTGRRELDGARRVRTDGSTANLTGYDQAMLFGGLISGSVRTTAGPQGDVCVNAGHLTGTDRWEWLAGTRSASDGSFRLGPIPPGDTVIHANACDGGSAVIQGLYAGPGVPLTRDFADAAVLRVALDPPVSGVDITVEIGAMLSGVVTGNGAPLADACVTALDPTTGLTGSDGTESDGTWTTVVPPGSYLVQASSCRTGQALASRFYENASDPAGARTVPTASGDTVTGLDIDLPSANPGAIRGRLVTSTGVAPQACLVVVAPDTEPVAFAPNATDGTFDLGGINPGSYLVAIAGCAFPDEGPPPGVIDPTDPSIVYPLQWSSGRSITQDTLWVDPAWVTVTSDAATDLGTICLQPCADPTVVVQPAPTEPTTEPTPTTPVPDTPVTGTPTGFAIDPAPTTGTETPAAATSISTDILAARAIAPAPPAAAADADRADPSATADETEEADATRVIAGETQAAAARRTGSGQTGDGGAQSWWWVFVLAAVIATIAVGVPWLRGRSARLM